MKKVFLQLCALISAVFLAFGMTACGPEKIEGDIEIDKNKTQIYFRCFAGGFGKDYANYFAEEWNKTQEEYQVIPITEKFEYSIDLQPNWAIGNFENMDIVLAENLPVREAAKLGYIMDISDVWTSSAPGESESIEGKTICAVDAITFDFSKSTIKPESYEYLDKLATTLIRSNRRIEVKGHTDNVGSEDFNMNLSRERAEAVVEYLVKKGVNRNKLTYSYYGMTRPLTTNDTEEGRAMNRRVEFTILNSF